MTGITYLGIFLAAVCKSGIGFLLVVIRKDPSIKWFQVEVHHQTGLGRSVRERQPLQRGES